MAGLVQFNRFYIEHGIRNIGQMMTLRKNDITQFTYPLNTTLHFGVREIGEIGLPQEDELFTNAGTRILTNYINQYSRSANIGAPIKVQRLFIKEVKDFLKQNKRFKYIEHSRSWLDVPAVPFIVNYSSVDRTYKYRQREGVDYWRRLNFFSTIVDGVVEQLDKTQRNQFMYFDIPDFLPGLNRLEEAEKNLLKAEDRELPLERRLRNFFNSDGRHIVLEFWLWAGENRHLSVFSKIPEDKLDRVTFMTSLDGRYNVLNLGVFDKWIRDEQNNNGALTYRRAQRVMLRHFMAIQQIRSVSDDTIIVDSASELEKSDAEKTLGIKIDEGRLSDLIENDSEYLSELPADPLLEVNIDARDFQKGKTLDIRTKAKVTAEDPINGKLSDEEDFLFDQMERDLQQHTVTSAQIEVDQLIDSESVYRAYEPEERHLDTKINKVADQLAAKGLLSSAEVRRVKGLGVRYQRIKSPFDPEQTIEEYMEINPESLLIKEDTRLTEKNIRGVLDDSMMHYSIQDFDSRYISEIMGKDIVNAFMHFQHAGVAVTDVNISRTDEYLGSYQTISLQLTPVIGKPSTVRLKIPVIDRDGIFVANGVKYRMKKQRVDAPIRKVSHDSVALTSYMSKMFVNRTPRVRYNYGSWIVNQINLMALDSKSGLGEVRHGNAFTREHKLPITYTSISREIVGFRFGGVAFHFDYENLETNFPEAVLAQVDLSKYVPFAVKQTPVGFQVMVLDKDDRVSIIDLGQKNIREVGKFSELLGLGRGSEPVNFAEVAVLGNDVPICLILGYQIGFGNLLKTTGVTYRREKRGSSFPMADNEFTLIFEDEVLIFNRDDPKAALIFNGFNRLKTAIRRISVYSLDKPENYAALVKGLGIPLDHLKQYTNIFDVWVDHITRDLLLNMKEPTDLVLLFLSAIDKLSDDTYSDPNGVNDSVLRGYQRISGMVYSSLHKAVRSYVKNPMSKNASIDLNPKDVWFSITQDQTVAPIEESNPIHAIKEKEVVVFRGQGGRGADTMTAKHRQFTRDAVGIISEANVDNGQVGTIAYLTADPNIVDLRGTTRKIEDLTNVGKAKVQSTAMMLSPGSDTDD